MSVESSAGLGPMTHHTPKRLMTRKCMHKLPMRSKGRRPVAAETLMTFVSAGPCCDLTGR